MRSLFHEYFNVVVPAIMTACILWTWQDYRTLLRRIRSFDRAAPASSKPTPEISGAISWAIRSSGKSVLLVVAGLIALFVRAEVIDRNQAALLACVFVGVLVAALLRYMTHGLPDRVWQQLIREARQLP